MNSEVHIHSAERCCDLYCSQIASCKAVWLCACDSQFYECHEWCRWKVKSKKLERDVEKHRKIGEMAELRCTELEQELDTLKAQRNSNTQQFEQLKKQFTDILVCMPLVCLSVGHNSYCVYE